MKGLSLKKTELYLFLIFSFVALLPFFLVKYVPSLDGPQHLYTARLITELIKGNEFISQYYMFNPLLAGNQSSLYIMAFLMFVFPAWLAEKIFLSLYIIGLALSFRYFIKSVTKTGSLLYLLIFPFAFTSLFMLGYYNFSLAFIPFFLALGYFKRVESRLGVRQGVWLTILCLLIFLTHAIVFVFFGLIIFLQSIFDLAYPLIFRSGAIKTWTAVLKRYFILLLTALPAIVLWYLYYRAFNVGGRNLETVSFRPVSEIMGELYRLRILIGFVHQGEAGSNAILFFTMMALILSAVIPLHRYFPRLTEPADSTNPDWLKWTFIAIVLLLLALIFPDHMVTGSMSARLCILFFFVLISWISLQSFPKTVIIIALLLIMGAFTWHRVFIYDCYKKLNREIVDIENAGKCIEPGTILYAINYSSGWYNQHFHFYLGVDKPVVDLQNPQANGPMPLVWNYAKMPNALLGRLNQTESGATWVSGNPYLAPVSANYIFTWNPLSIKSNEEVTALLTKVSPYYSQAFTSNNKKAILYQLN